MILDNSRKLSSRSRRQFLTFSAIASVLVVSAAAVHYRANLSADRSALETSERLNVKLGVTTLGEELRSLGSDVLFLAKNNELKGAFASDDRALRQALAQELKIFIKEKRVYDQIRYIGLDGIELVRVNFNSGDVEVVPQHRLQNKAGRYYVTESLKTPRGQIYVSPLDLNIEQGAVEQPIKPVIRIGTPVFDRSRRKVGILLVNYLAERMLVKFRRTTANIADRILLLNAAGYWISSPRRNEEWGFVYGHDDSFAARYPRAWKQIHAVENGQFVDELGMFTFVTVHPGVGATSKDSSSPTTDQPDSVWKVVSHVSNDRFYLASALFTRRYLPFYLLILLLLGVSTALLARSVRRTKQAEAQVDFEKRFRAVLENVDLLAVGLDRSGRIVFANHALLRVSGWKLEQIIEKNWFQLFLPAAQQAEATQSFKQVVNGERGTEPHTLELVTAAGDMRWVAWNDTLLFGVQGEIIGLTLIGEDVTDAHRMQERLKRTSQALEQSPSSVVITNTKAEIEYVNPKFTELTGYSLSEVLGQNPRILQSCDFSAEKYKAMWERLIAGDEWHGVFHNKKKNGDLYWEAASIKGVRDETGDITHYVAVKEDITARVRLEERVRLFFDASPNAMMLVDEAGKIVMINSALENCFGYEDEELLGQYVEKLLPAQVRDAHRLHRNSFMKHSKARQMGIDGNLSALRKDGTTFPVEVGLNPIATDEGKFVLSAIVDTTMRKRLEAELESQNREIAHNETLAAIGRMASMVAHDLRNPLSSIKMGLQILVKRRKDGVNGASQELGEIALEQVRYMEQILDDLLSYSRPDALNLEWLSIEKLIEPAIILSQEQLRDPSVNVKLMCQPGLPTLHGDANRLRQALTNLISNAAQATKDNTARAPEIDILTQVELKNGQPHIRIEIHDNGCGIREEEVDKLFEPFYTNRATGTGLGLAIAKRIVEQHNGTLALKPNVNAGTCAIITLPTGPLTSVREPATASFIQSAETQPELNQNRFATNSEVSHG